MLRSGLRSPRMAGVAPSTWTPIAPMVTPMMPPRKTKQRRLIKNHPHDPSPRPADRKENADFMGALENRHQHGVHHAEHTDEDAKSDVPQLMARPCEILRCG